MSVVAGSTNKWSHQPIMQVKKSLSSNLRRIFLRSSLVSSVSARSAWSIMAFRIMKIPSSAISRCISLSSVNVRRPGTVSIRYLVGVVQYGDTLATPEMQRRRRRLQMAIQVHGRAQWRPLFLKFDFKWIELNCKLNLKFDSVRVCWYNFQRNSTAHNHESKRKPKPHRTFTHFPSKCFMFMISFGHSVNHDQRRHKSCWWAHDRHK